MASTRDRRAPPPRDRSGGRRGGRGVNDTARFVNGDVLRRQERAAHLRDARRGRRRHLAGAAGEGDGVHLLSPRARPISPRIPRVWGSRSEWGNDANNVGFVIDCTVGADNGRRWVWGCRNQQEGVN